MWRVPTSPKALDATERMALLMSLAGLQALSDAERSEAG
jgi:hypothetical protein